MTKLAMNTPVEADGDAPSFSVDIYVVEGSNVGSLAFSIAYDNAHAVVDGITWHGAFRDGIRFGPTYGDIGVSSAGTNSNRADGVSETVTFGVYSEDGSVSSNTKVATVTFRELGTGETSIGLTSVQAASGRSHMMQTEITSSDEIVTLDGEAIFVPLIQ